jgi:hypothetical protein
MDASHSKVMGRAFLNALIWAMTATLFFPQLSHASCVCDLVEPDGLRINAYVTPLGTRKKGTDLFNWKFCAVIDWKMNLSPFRHGS